MLLATLVWGTNTRSTLHWDVAVKCQVMMQYATRLQVF